MEIRYPAVAGQFYPENKSELKRIIEEFLKNAKIEKIEGEILGFISPHAGYVFSGQVAAYNYKAIYQKSYETVILIGDSHYEFFDGISVWPKGEWETPLGKVMVDENLAKEIISLSPRIFRRDSAHLFEHSLEVQIPFLQIVLKEFKILPLIFGSENKDWKTLAKAILKLMERKKILIVVSSDLSHYPTYEEAQKVDKETIEAILNLDGEGFTQKIKNLERKYYFDTLACAQDAIKTILEIKKSLKLKGKLLKYQNSGDSKFGDKFRVVGYSAIVFHR